MNTNGGLREFSQEISSNCDDHEQLLFVVIRLYIKVFPNVSSVLNEPLQPAKFVSDCVDPNTENSMSACNTCTIKQDGVTVLPQLEIYQLKAQKKS
jgi:hypothetical protein